jgi:hypothetical protein
MFEEKILEKLRHFLEKTKDSEEKSGRPLEKLL